MSSTLPQFPPNGVIGYVSGRQVVLDPVFIRSFIQPLIERAGGTVALTNIELAQINDSLGVVVAGIQAEVDALQNELDVPALSPPLLPGYVPDEPSGRVEQLEAQVQALAAEINAIKQGALL